MELTGRIQAWGDTNSRNRLAGVAITVLLAWAWSRYGRRVNLALFFQVTSIFLLLFALQLLLIYTPVLNRIFDTAPLSALELGLCAGCAVVVLIAVESEKWLVRHGLIYRASRTAPAGGPLS